jgi:hypothetical protein
MTTGVLGCCLALATACGGDDPAAGTPGPGAGRPTLTTPAGFKRVGDVPNGVTVAVPESWVTLDLSRDDLEQGLSRSGLSGAVLEQFRQGLRALVPSKAVWAADPRSAEQSKKGFPTNLNGFCQPSIAVPAQQRIDDAKQQLSRLKAEVSEAAEVTLGTGKAVRIVYTFDSGGNKIRGTQYYLPGRGKTCIVTLSTDRDDRQELFDRIGGTASPL